MSVARGNRLGKGDNPREGKNEFFPGKLSVALSVAMAGSC